MTATMERGGAPGVEAGYRTVAWRVRCWAQQRPDAVAMREKDLGIWREITWGSLWDQVLTAAHGLLAMDIDVGEVVSIHSEDRPEWIILDVAAVAVRATTTGMYPTNPAAEVEYLLADSGARVHLAEDQEQIDKVLGLPGDRFANLHRIIYCEPRGVRSYRDPRLLSWDAFMAIGAEHRLHHLGAVEERMAAAEPDDIMTLVYTSGTTGPPKGAMLSNRNAEFAMDTIVNVDGRLPGNHKPGPDDQILTYLPLCHVAERIFSTWTMAAAGTVLNFAESIETVQLNLREVQPTLFFAVPRIWEKIHATVMIKLADASWVKRRVGGVGMALARYIGRARVGNAGNHT
ncbi:MAG: AMP-binding protein, partial [Acidimicrobiia bacterium]|nr:AMP-binding protein [Acidimicrobiia bacterium]